MKKSLKDSHLSHVTFSDFVSNMAIKGAILAKKCSYQGNANFATKPCVFLQRVLCIPVTLSTTEVAFSASCRLSLVAKPDDAYFCRRKENGFGDC